MGVLVPVGQSQYINLTFGDAKDNSDMADTDSEKIFDAG